METPVGLTALRQDLTHIIDEVKYRGTQFVVMRYDEPAAALLPIDLYERWKCEREELSEALRDIGQQRPGTETDRVMSEFLAALQQVREGSSG
ncbi:MAG: type II toxin-antitoxin system Phd/YefM family antitoxin [Chloroflexi bacterium]|jgi:prevent-host-death family protein|nr:type II toxin-antitoxin system Phd/YefM family antitoxin [Chloroflexota bacterium]